MASSSAWSETVNQETIAIPETEVAAAPWQRVLQGADGR